MQIIISDVMIKTGREKRCKTWTTMQNFWIFLLERFQIERKRFDRSGVYAYTQRLLAYNSNKIEGSTLTEEQTASLFDTGTLPRSDDCYRAKDVEEMNGHFLMFNKMLDTLDDLLNGELIKQFHYELKSGVFEDRANGYAIGDYKKKTEYDWYVCNDKADRSRSRNGKIVMLVS